MNKKKLAKAASTIVIITILSKIVGFLRDSLTARAFGTSYQTDAYTVANTIPYVIFSIIGVAITTAFIPLLNESYTKHGKDDMYKFANSVMNILFIISIILYAIGWIASPIIVKMIAPAYTGVKYAMTLKLTRLIIINILFMSMNSGYAAVLQALDDFTAPTLTGFMMNIPVIFYTLFMPQYGIVGLTYATIIGFSIQIFIQIPWLIKNKYKFEFGINFKDPRLKRMLYLITPVLIGLSVSQINVLVDRMMASGLPTGSITALNYANTLNNAIYGIFAYAVVTVIFPTLSKDISLGNLPLFKGHISKAITNINMIMIPSSIGLMILRVPIVTVMYKHGQFTSHDVQMTSTALLFFAFGMIFYGIRDVFNRAFYSLNDTKTPMINGVIGVIANIILNLLIVRRVGIGGLSFSTSVSAVICSMLLLKRLREKIDGINGRVILQSSTKIIISTAIMGVFVYFTRNFLAARLFGFRGNIIIVAVSIMVGVIVYAISLFALKEKEFLSYLGLFTRKLKVKMN